jgi:hypothetical protein
VKLIRSLAVVAATVVLMTGLAACSVSPFTGRVGPSSSATVPEASYGPLPSWANPLTTPGNLLTSVTGTNFKADIYQVATAPAAKDGQFADPSTGKPIIKVGDKIVYVNYVFTNTGTSTIRLGNDLVSIEPRYANWPYLQGMDSIADAEQAKAMKVNLNAFGPSAGSAPFDWKPGASFSYGENFTYESNSAISFTVTVIPVSASDAPDVAKKQIVTASTTIK